MRTFAVVLVVALAAAGCAAPAAPYGSGMAPEGMADAAGRATTQGGGTTVGDALLSVPETALWVPYRIVSSVLSGAYRGAADGFTAAPLPLFGVLMSPVTAGIGAVSGAVQGLTRGPWYLGTHGDFSRALGQPWLAPAASPWSR